MGLGRSVAALRKRLKLTHEQIGSAVGTTAQNIANMESRDSRRSSYASRLADFFALDLRTLEADDFNVDALPAQELQRIQASVRRRTTQARTRMIEPNVKAPPPMSGKVPLIGWNSVSVCSEIPAVFESGLVEDWVAPSIPVGPRSFALRAIGDSMFNPSDARSIPDGAEVVIDPDRPPSHGKVVLARPATSEHRATLRVLWYDGTTPYLKPLNERYPLIEMTEDTRILGVAVEYIIRKPL